MAYTFEQMRHIIEVHKKKAQHDQKEWDKHRKTYLSEEWAAQDNANLPARLQGKDSEELNLETNYPYAYVDTMVASVCPTNPRVDVFARRERLRDQAEGRAALINDTFYRCDFFKRLWEAARRASVFPRSFTKVTWDPRRKRPSFRVLNPHFVWFDQSASIWDDISYIIEVTVMKRSDFERLTKKPGPGNTTGRYKAKAAKGVTFGRFPTWLKDQARDRASINDASMEAFEYTVVYEFYDLSEAKGRFYHISEDVEEPLFAGDLPYRFLRNPFHMLVFNDNLYDLGGVSDVKLIANMQSRLNELETLQLRWLQTSLPFVLFDKMAVDNPEQIAENVQQNSSGGPILIPVDRAVDDQTPISNIFYTVPMPSLPITWDKEAEKLDDKIQYILGIPAYARGAVGTTDVATEVALADTATRTRNGHRQKCIYDLVKWAAIAIIGLYEEYLDPNDPLPVRLLDSDEVLDLTPDGIGARKPEYDDQGEELDPSSLEDPLDYDYEVSAYSPAENNKLLQLRQLQELFPVLAQGVQPGFVDGAKLYKAVLELMGLKFVQPKPGQPVAGQAPPGAPPGVGGMPLPPGASNRPGAPGPTDTVAGGALPPGAEVPIPPAQMGGAGNPAPAGSGIPGSAVGGMR